MTFEQLYVLEPFLTEDNMINQDFIDKYVAKNTAELIASRLKLETYLLDHGFTKTEADKIIKKGTQALREHLLKNVTEKLTT